MASSTVHAYGCTFAGMPGSGAVILPGPLGCLYVPSTPGTRGLGVESGFLFLGSSTLQGGNGGRCATYSGFQCLTTCLPGSPGYAVLHW